MNDMPVRNSEIVRWTTNRFPWLLFVGILGLGIAQSPNGEAFSILPTLLSVGAFVFWLAWVARSQEDCGRRWVKSPAFFVPFLGLAGYAAIIPIAPVTEKEFGKTVFVIVQTASLISALSYFVVWEHLAISLSRSAETGLGRLGVYAITMFLSVMPPIGILWFYLFRRRGRNGVALTTRGSGSVRVASR